MHKYGKALCAMLALSSAATFSLTACGEKKDTAATTAPAATSAATSAAPAVKGKITLVTNGVEYKPVTEKFRKEFPGVELIWDQQASTNYTDVYKTRLAAGSENIDLVIPGRADYPTLSTNGQLLELTGKPFLSNYTDGVVESSTINGKVFGVAMTANVYNVWYNKDVFKKLGLSEPKDYEEFLKVCETIKSNQMVPVVTFAKADGFHTPIGFFFHSALSADPAMMTKLGNGQAKWTDENMVKSVQKFTDFVNKGYILDGSLSLDDTQAYQAFYQGKAAMMFNGAWSIDKIVNTPPTFEVGTFPYLSDKGVTNRAAYVPGSIISASAQTKSKDACLAFIDWISKVENSQLWCNEAKQFGTVKGVTSEFSPMAKLLAPIYAMPKTPMFHAYLGANTKTDVYVEFQKLMAAKETKATPESAVKSIQTFQDKDVKK